MIILEWTISALCQRCPLLDGNQCYSDSYEHIDVVPINLVCWNYFFYFDFFLSLQKFSG